MFCAISGNAPTNPVVSKVSGHLFDRDTITHALKASGGKCPVTGESLSEDDLLSVKVNPTPKPRPIAAASIPGMLSLFQSEWDALVLELHTLKQQHDAVRQELAHALYQHDAACRVIARLIKERDDARTALAAVQPAPVARPEAPRADAPSEGMTPAILAKFTSTSKELSKGRKKRQPPEGQASEETVAKFVLLKSQPLHEAGRTCVEMHAQQPVAASGGGGGKVVLFECEGGGQTSFEGHTAQVNRVRLHPSKPLLVSCGADATSRVWRTDGALLHTLSGHAADVTDVSLHATGDFYVSASADKSWNLNDIERGTCVLAVKGADEGYACADFHPDGLILGTGTGAVVRVWDVKSQANAATFAGHAGAVRCLAFSENGYYLATGGADASVKLWDLRKLKNFHTLSLDGEAAAVAFDYSGQFLLVGGDALSVFESKSWARVNSFGAAATGVSFGAAAKSIAAAGADGVLKLYGTD